MLRLTVYLSATLLMTGPDWPTCQDHHLAPQSFQQGFRENDFGHRSFPCATFSRYTRFGSSECFARNCSVPTKLLSYTTDERREFTHCSYSVSSSACHCATAAFRAPLAQFRIQNKCVRGSPAADHARPCKPKKPPGGTTAGDRPTAVD